MNQEKNQENLLELAKQGNLEALDILTNRALQPKGITAKIAFKNESLHVLFESKQMPNQQQLVSWLHEGITKIGIESIETINVYGKLTSEEIPDWHQVVNLEKNITLDSDNLSQQNQTIADIIVPNYCQLKFSYTLASDNVSFTSIVFSHDSKTLISGGKNVVLWNLNNCKMLRVLSGHTGLPAVISVAISPNGDWIASGGAGDSLVKLWNFTDFLNFDGGQTINLIGHKSTWLSHVDTRLNPTITSVAFSPDGRIIASSGCDKTVKLWHTKSGQEIYTFSESQAVVSLVFSPNGKKLLGGINNTVKIWDLTTNEESSFIARAPVRSVAINPNGYILACGDMFGGVTLWDLRTKQVMNFLSLYPDNVSNSINTISFSPDGLVLATGSSNKIIKVIPILTANSEVNLIGHSNSINAVCFSPNGCKLASASNDNTIKVWETTSEIITM